MERKKLYLWGGAILIVILGATAWHQIRRAQALREQERLKQRGVAVTTVKVAQRDFRNSIAFTGTLLAVNRAELKAEVAGRVTRVTVSEGDRVSQGAVLSTQDEEDLQLAVQAAEAQLAQAQAQSQQAQRDNDRAQMLLEKRSITKQAAQQSETMLNSSMAAMRAAESNVGIARSRLHKAQIRAPFSGQVAQRIIQPGDMLNPGQTVFMVVDNRTLEILADLPAEAAAQVEVGMGARFKVNALPDSPVIAGKVTQVAPSLLADGRTLRVRIEVSNPENKLKSGYFAEGEILATKMTQRPALPSALMIVQERAADVMVCEQNIARRKRVQVGAEQDGWRPVEGLALGTLVIAQGREQVEDGGHVIIQQEGN